MAGPKKKKKQTLTSVGRRLDVLARHICKELADYTCQRCGRVGDSSTIEWAHIEKRSKKAIRWSQMNCLALCNSKLNNCHYWFDNNRAVSMKWLDENFPEKHAWLIEEEMGIPRAQMLSTDTLDDRLALEESLKEIKRNLSD